MSNLDASLQRTLTAKPGSYDDPWIRLSLGIVENAVHDLIIGYVHMLKEFGEIREATFRADHRKKHWKDRKADGSKKKYQAPAWIMNWETAYHFLGSTWYNEITNELDPGKLKKMAIDEAYDIWRKKQHGISKSKR